MQNYPTRTSPFLRSATAIVAILLATYAPSATPVAEISDKEAARQVADVEGRTAVSLADGLKASVWATEALMLDPVGIDVDNQGRAWVSVTRRRRSSMFDIRGHPDWIAESWSWTSVEERRAFLKREFAPTRSDENRWLQDFNKDGSHDWKDLRFEAEQIFRIEDRSGDGYADYSKQYNWFPSNELTDIAGTVLYHDGSVYVGLPPDLWRMEDKDGDDEFESQTSISSGYGIHIGYGGHGFSGLKTGPDGRIYWAIGDIGFSGTDLEGNSWDFPRQGIIARSEADGSNFEVFAHGLRNVHEFDWDQYGNLIGVDNDGDHAGEEERIVHLIHGSDTGWRNNWQLGKYSDPKNNTYKVWMDESYYKPRFYDQAAHILPAIANYHSGPAGMVYQPGTAFDGKWENHFIVASFTGNAANSALYAFSLEAKGASFRLDRDEKIFSGVTAVGIDFGPDGALYLADWAEGWDTDGIGRIWKIDTKNPKSRNTLLVESIIKDGFETRDQEELLALLKNDDRRVRLAAQFELVRRQDVAGLQKAAASATSQMARIHAIWGLGQLCRAGHCDPQVLEPLASHPDPETRAQIAKMWGDAKHTKAVPQLVEWLRDPDLRIQLQATEALGRMEASQAYADIVSMLEVNDDQDVYLRHAGAIALARIDNGDRIGALHKHPSKAVRIAAIVALFRLNHPAAARFLEDTDSFIASNAARAINDDDFIPSALPRLADTLNSKAEQSEAFTRRSINANLYVGGQESAFRLATFATTQTHPENLRIEAVNTLAHWSDPSVYDRVTGRVRELPENKLQESQLALSESYRTLLEDKSTALRISAIEALGKLQIADASEALLTIVSSSSDEDLINASLQTLADLKSEHLLPAIESALESNSNAVRAQALGLVAQLDLPPEQRTSLLANAWQGAAIAQKQSILNAIAKLDTDLATRFLSARLKDFVSGQLETGVQLDLAKAIESQPNSPLSQELQSHLNRRAAEGLLPQYEFAIEGGNPNRGKEIFYNEPMAQCLQCHAIDGAGGDVGPDLSQVALRLDRKGLLESLVDPSAQIALGYGNVSLNTTEGTLLGIKMEDDSNSVTLRLPDGKTRIVQRSQILNETVMPSSMPPLGIVLEKGKLRDLVAYLAQLDGNSEARPEQAGGHQ